MSGIAGRLIQIASGVLAAAILAGAAAGIVWLSTRSAAPLTAGVSSSSPTDVAALPTRSPAPTEVATMPRTDPPAQPSRAPTPRPTVAPDPDPDTDPTRPPTAPPDPTPPSSPPAPTPASSATPTPVPDPQPEGTPRIVAVSGTFGETLTVEGVTVTIEPVPALPKEQLCVTDDPERQGWTVVVSFSLLITWPDPTVADWPGVWVGEHPWHAIDFEGPHPLVSGAQYIVSTCKQPADTMKVTVEVDPPGSPLTIYYWRFE